MSCKIYSHSGTASDTSVATATQAPRFMKGPPQSGTFAYGLYILQTSSTQEYRWFDDVQTPGTKAPTTYSPI